MESGKKLILLTLNLTIPSETFSKIIRIIDKVRCAATDTPSSKIVSLRPLSEEYDRNETALFSPQCPCLG